MTAFMLLATPALATPSFDPTVYDEVFDGAQTYTIDGTAKLWSEIERHVDGDGTLFQDESYNAMTAWPEESKWAPYIAECFGDTEPGTGTFLLHVGTDEASATGTPILFVPGAGDNGSRGFITMAMRMNNTGRPVYALTFAHPHGDVFRQAEVVADAIARVQERTGAARVDLVSHSKGGIAAAVYLSNSPSATWNRSDYAASGTRYRGDVRRAVFIATPLGGIDTGYRWPSANYASLSEDLAMAPVSWATYYPYGSSSWWLGTDLTDQDFLSDGADYFPGHRQLLSRWDEVYPLPGSMPWLGVYAYQQDWYTTYHGGYGYYCYSDGIDEAIDDGGDLLARLAANGVDPDVELFLLAGENPLMPNGSEDFLSMYMSEVWIDLATASVDLWAALVAELVEDSYVAVGISQEEVQGLAAGKLMLGEISGPSDGLVFVDSATMGSALTARGAAVVETRVANLSHLDLLYASPVTGALLIAEADADPVEDGWKRAVGERYTSEDTLGWVETVLADGSDTGDGDTGDGDTGDGDSGGADTGDGGSGGGDPEDTAGSTTDTETDPEWRSSSRSSGCAAVVPASGALWLLGLAGLLQRRRVGTRRARSPEPPGRAPLG